MTGNFSRSHMEVLEQGLARLNGRRVPARIRNRIETSQVGMLCRIDSQAVRCIFAHHHESSQQVVKTFKTGTEILPPGKTALRSNRRETTVKRNHFLWKKVRTRDLDTRCIWETL